MGQSRFYSVSGWGSWGRLVAREVNVRRETVVFLLPSGSRLLADALRCIVFWPILLVSSSVANIPATDLTLNRALVPGIGRVGPLALFVKVALAFLGATSSVVMVRAFWFRDVQLAIRRRRAVVGRVIFVD